MAYTIPRPKLTWAERLFLPVFVSGLAITWKHLKNRLLGRTKVTMEYPEQEWDSREFLACIIQQTICFCREQ